MNDRENTDDAHVSPSRVRRFAAAYELRWRVFTRISSAFAGLGDFHVEYLGNICKSEFISHIRSGISFTPRLDSQPEHITMSEVELLEEPITEAKEETAEVAGNVEFADTPKEAEPAMEIAPVVDEVIATEIVDQITPAEDVVAPVDDESAPSEIAAETVPVQDESIPSEAVEEVAAVQDEIIPSVVVAELTPVADVALATDVVSELAPEQGEAVPAPDADECAPVDKAPAPVDELANVES